MDLLLILSKEGPIGLLSKEGLIHRIPHWPSIKGRLVVCKEGFIVVLSKDDLFGLLFKEGVIGLLYKQGLFGLLLTQGLIGLLSKEAPINRRPYWSSIK